MINNDKKEYDRIASAKYYQQNKAIIAERRKNKRNINSIIQIPAPIVQIPGPIVQIPAPIVQIPGPIVQIPAPIVQIPAPIKKDYQINKQNKYELIEQISLELSYQCANCEKTFYNKSTAKIYNNNKICDYCYTHDNKIKNDNLFKQKIIKAYLIKIGNKCNHCQLINDNDNNCRFHWDHLNMFDKNKTIHEMANDGTPYHELITELKKCQFLCISCHSRITEIERKLGFIKIKQSLSRDKNAGKITFEEHSEYSKIMSEQYMSYMNEFYCILNKSNGKDKMI
jgi:hypothetical protein